MEEFFSMLITTAFSAIFMSLFMLLFRKIKKRSEDKEQSKENQKDSVQETAVNHQSSVNTKVNDYMLVGCLIIGGICLIGYFLTK